MVCIDNNEDNDEMAHISTSLSPNSSTSSPVHSVTEIAAECKSTFGTLSTRLNETFVDPSQKSKH